MTSRREKIDYFWATFDSYLRAGDPGRAALLKAADDYSFVFSDGDGRSELSRAATLALEQLKNAEVYVDGCPTCRSDA